MASLLPCGGHYTLHPVFKGGVRDLPEGDKAAYDRDAPVLQVRLVPLLDCLVCATCLLDCLMRAICLRDCLICANYLLDCLICVLTVL